MEGAYAYTETSKLSYISRDLGRRKTYEAPKAHGDVCKVMFVFFFAILLQYLCVLEVTQKYCKAMQFFAWEPRSIAR